MPRPTPKDLEHQARRRLRRVTPDNAGKVVSLDIYWTVPFLELFLERCDAVAFEAPSNAYKLAFHAPSLADLIGVGNRAGEYAGEKEKRSFQVRARGILGSACHRIGKTSDAARAYAQAQDLLKCGDVLPMAKADLLMRLGNFTARTTERGNTKALGLLNQALDIFSCSKRSELALALVLRGTWFWEAGEAQQAAIDYAQAISVAAQHAGCPRAERASVAAFGNLSRVLADHQLFCMDYDRALALIQQARKRMSTRRLSSVKAKLYWTEGTLHRKLLLEQPAIRLLQKARAGFLELGMPEEYLLTSLELAGLATSQDLESLREETGKGLSAIASDSSLMAVLRHWGPQSNGNDLKDLHQAVFARQDP